MLELAKSGGGSNARRVVEILDRHRNSMERSSPMPGSDFSLRLACLKTSEVAGDRDERVSLTSSVSMRPRHFSTSAMGDNRRWPTSRQLRD